jgi:hypothetical protein
LTELHGAARRRERTASLVVFLLGFCSRIPFFTSTEQDLDGARFVAGVLRYDLTRLHPHPPGYPVLMGAAIAVQRLTDCSAAVALSAVSAVGFALLLVSVWSIGAALEWAMPRRALAVLLTALCTGVSVLSVRPLSDSLGMGLAWLTVAIAVQHSTSRSRATATLVCAALTAGVRLSLVPFVALACGAVLWAHETRRGKMQAIAAGAVCAVASWLPVVALTGTSAFVRVVVAQGRGHFAQFGGSVSTDPSISARISATLYYLWTHVLSGAWSDRSASLGVSSAVTVAVLSLLLLRRGGHTPAHTPAVGRAIKLIVACNGSYFVWVFLGQNVLWAPRHLIVMTPAIVLMLTAAIARVERRWLRSAIAATIVLAWGQESLRLMSVQQTVRPPALCLVEQLARLSNARQTLVASSQLGQWLRMRAPDKRILNFTNASEAAQIAAANHWRLLATSELNGVDGIPELRPWGSRCEGDRYVWPAMYQLQWLSSPLRAE